MSDIKKAISTLKKSFERFSQDFLKALSSLETAAEPPSTIDKKLAIGKLFEKQSSMTLNDIKTGIKASALKEIKPIIEVLIKEGTLTVDESTLGKSGKPIGDTIIQKGSRTTSVRQVINEKDFLNISREEYNRLVLASAVTPYVEIEKLRNRVTQRLGISSNEFNTLLTKLNTQNPARVQLDPGTGKSGLGIATSRGICYFVIIR